MNLIPFGMRLSWLLVLLTQSALLLFPFDSQAQSHLEIIKSTPCLYEYRYWLNSYPRRGEFKAPEGFTSEQCAIAIEINKRLYEERYEADLIKDPSPGPQDSDEASIPCLHEYRLWRSIYKDESQFEGALNSFPLFKIEGKQECVEAKRADERIRAQLQAKQEKSRLEQEKVRAKRLAAIQEEEKDPLKKLSSKRDEMKDITWYQHKSSPSSILSNGVYLYFGKTTSGSFTAMRLVVRYYAEDWLFIRKAWGKADGVQVVVPHEKKGIGRWNGEVIGSNIVEWSDVAVTAAEDIKAVRSLAGAKKSVIRLEGGNFYSDKTLSSAQQRALREVIAAYEHATGKVWQ